MPNRDLVDFAPKNPNPRDEAPVGPLVVPGSLSMVADECVDEAGAPVLIQDSINNDDSYTLSAKFRIK